jgi:hypothetical protein
VIILRPRGEDNDHELTRAEGERRGGVESGARVEGHQFKGNKSALLRDDDEV